MSIDAIIWPVVFAACAAFLLAGRLWKPRCYDRADCPCLSCACGRAEADAAWRRAEADSFLIAGDRDYWEALEAREGLR